MNLRTSILRILAIVPVFMALTSFAKAQASSTQSNGSQSNGRANPEENFGSLTPTKYKPAFRTRTAITQGDIVTIIISEVNQAQFQGGTQVTKQEQNNVGPNSVPLANWLKVGLLDTLLSGGSTNVNSQMNTQGQTTAQNRFSARMAAVVKQVLPNGTLLIEGTRQVKINKEAQLLTLSGVIRQDDVRGDNTVLSENIANAEIKSEGVGLIYDRQRKGLLTRLLDWLF